MASEFEKRAMVPEVSRELVNEIMRKEYVVAITSEGTLRIRRGEFVETFHIQEAEYALKQQIRFEDFREVTKPAESLNTNGALGSS